MIYSMKKDVLIDEAAAYIERYRSMPSMTSHRIARHILSMTDDIKEPEEISSTNSPDPVIPIRWITRQWIQKLLDMEDSTSLDLFQMELNHLAKMYEYQKNNIK